MATRTQTDADTAKTVATEDKPEGGFKPVKLVHKDGRERTVTTPREAVEARFAGFAEKRK